MDNVAKGSQRSIRPISVHSTPTMSIGGFCNSPAMHLQPVTERYRIYAGRQYPDVWIVRRFDGSDFFVCCNSWKQAVQEMYKDIARRGLSRCS